MQLNYSIALDETISFVQEDAPPRTASVNTIGNLSTTGRRSRATPNRLGRTSRCPERFPLIYAVFRGFQQLYTIEDQLACLACIRAHLAPDGCFAFDVFNPRLDRIWEEEQDLRFRVGHEDVVRWVATHRDRPGQLIHLTMRYERRREGRVVGEELARFRMRWFCRFELVHLMARAGFSQVEIHGDFDGSPFGRESPTVIVVASP